VRSAPYLSLAEGLSRPAVGTPASKNGKPKGAEAEARQPEPKLLGAGDALLPFVAAFQEVLQEEEDEGEGQPEDSGDLRAQGFIATLLNFIWLEPFAGLLPNPPKEVLHLVQSGPLRGDDADGSLGKKAEVS